MSVQSVSKKMHKATTLRRELQKKRMQADIQRKL